MMKVILLLDERWKKIKRYPYKISSHGKVKRMTRCTNTYVGKILKPRPDSNGYLRVCFYKNGKGIDFLIHKLVAEAFIGPCPKDKEVNHKDGNKQFNYFKNLEYITHKENIKHAYKLGLNSHRGENCHFSKLIKKDVVRIRSMYETGIYTHENIANEFNVSRRAIGSIVKRKCWKHI